MCPRGVDLAPHQHPCTKFQSLIHRIHFISLPLQLQSSAASGPHREVIHSCERQVSDAPDHLPGLGSTNGSEPGSLSPPHSHPPHPRPQTAANSDHSAGTDTDQGRLVLEDSSHGRACRRSPECVTGNMGGSQVPLQQLSSHSEGLIQLPSHRSGLRSEQRLHVVLVLMERARKCVPAADRTNACATRALT